MAQQPLQGRGLSRTVLTPPDILGERMQLEQLGLRQDALRASQMGKQPRPKFGEGKEFDLTEGKYFVDAQQKLVKEYNDFMLENGVASNDANYGTPYFDENAYRKRKNMEANLARFLYQTKEQTDELNKNIKSLDPREISVSGVLDWAEGVNRDINGTVTFDEAGNIVYGDGQDVFSSEYITKPEAFYFTPVNWSKDAIDQMVESYQSIGDQDRRKRFADVDNLRKQAKGILKVADNKQNYQKSFASDYLQDQYGLDPRQVTGAVNELITNGQIEVGEEVITLDDVTRWAEDFIVNQVESQMDTSDVELADGNGMEFNFGSWSSKADVTPLDARQTRVGNDLIDIEGGLAAKPGKYKIPISREMFPDQEPGEVVSADVDYIVTDGDNIYATVRGLRKNGSYLESRNVKLPSRLVKSLQTAMGVPENKTLKEILLEAGTGGTEESVDSEQEESPIEGYSMQDINDAANQAGMSVDEYVRWYKENYE